MKILSTTGGPWESKIEFYVTPDDVGKRFIIEGTMIPYSLGGGTMNPLKIKGEGVEAWYEEHTEEVDCEDCKGKGKKTFARRLLFGKREELYDCYTCGGKGKRTKYSQTTKPMKEIE